MIEDITDNMLLDGYHGIWYSFIDNMDTYRVQYIGEDRRIYKVENEFQTEIFDETIDKLLDMQILGVKHE